MARQSIDNINIRQAESGSEANRRKTAPDEHEEQASLAYIRQMVDMALHDLAVRRLVETHLSEWHVAYDEFRGPGSTRRRAAAIHGIYDSAVPLPDALMTSPCVTFLAEIRRIVTSAIEANGARCD